LACNLLYGAHVNIANGPAIRSTESPKAEATIKPDFLANDESVFQRLLENHLPRVRSIVERIRRRLPATVEADVLYSIGVTGLVAAARNYQPAKERSFGSYANTRIQGAILDELRRMDCMSRINRSKAKRLGSAISKLEQEQGGSVSGLRSAPKCI
jgi:RNA polymerase sigma factor (sigma-70 family)